MAILISIALLFVGIVVLVLIHVWVVGRAFRMGLQNNGNITNRTRLGSASMSRDDLEKLPCFAFKAKDQTSSPADCAVCLDKFKAGEKCRLLPLCRHSFHAECVDVWLLRTPVCPICRARADDLAALTIPRDVDFTNLGFQRVIAIEMPESIDNPAEAHDRFLDSGMELSERQGCTQSSQENESRESDIMAVGQLGGAGRVPGECLWTNYSESSNENAYEERGMQTAEADVERFAQSSQENELRESDIMADGQLGGSGRVPGECLGTNYSESSNENAYEERGMQTAEADVERFAEREAALNLQDCGGILEFTPSR